MSRFRSTVLAAMLTTGLLCSAGLTTGPLAEQDGRPATPATVQPPLDSRARLDAWLEASRGMRDPLDAFSAGGRQRFLSGLQFGERGVVSLPFEDMRWELDQEQAQAVLTLLGLDADPIAKTLQTSPVPSSWRADPHRPSGIDQRYSEYIALTRAATRLDDLARARHAGAGFRQVFPRHLVEGAAKLGNPDLLLLTRATSIAANDSGDPGLAEELLTLIDLLGKRGMQSHALIESAQRALLASAKLDDARALVTHFPALKLASVPAVVTPADALPTGPRWWRLSADGTRMDAATVDLSDLQILVLAGCHFSVDAARDIASDPELAPVFAAHAHWIGQPPGIEDLNAWKDWNAQFPNSPMYLVTRRSDWALFRNWPMPTYAVIRSGKVLEQMSGAFGNAPELRLALIAMLGRHGLMSPANGTE
ncbi:hypothetical protein [Pseudoxanthomonas composti]|uniref:Uncharacterized protein n=1 Tax=Pseudoxanthomonas composti TaxID=2137479 RepID=A0A4Q1JXT1_9GAMM|nr:hypothetical protein [Pseudoxanthomonas composti]RXR07120.1 hypothetical protein EPA99_04140 [Pseudoxanthomonas composti]